MAKIRVLVVEDSLTVRKRLCEVLAADPDIEVVGEAEDGKTAIESCRKLRPDVVTLDMILPLMSGLAVTEYVMAYCPTPILIVSASSNRSELLQTCDALAAGAVDALEKPLDDEPNDAWERKFVAAVKLVSRIRVITHPRARLRTSSTERAGPRVDGVPDPDHPRSVVAIGASTGGPGALAALLGSLPAPHPVPILIVLHLGELFASAFVQWLEGVTGHRVSYARDWEPLREARGRVLLAPPDRHLVVVDGRVRLTHDEARLSCRPSVDVLFESLARECGPETTACLLTGMGRDGAEGLLAVRRAGGLTIAQDEATSVVYGMPREAVAIGAACHVLPLREIGAMLATSAARSPRGVER
jgi:two-component system, chemotaxis family, protein-glutamate methylesterase/glutaminase